MEWTRSETLALAANKCVHCHGLGMRDSRGSTQTACNCVFRAIFRVCHRKFWDISHDGTRYASVDFHRSGVLGRTIVGRLHQEYVADFLAVSKRNLDSEEHKIFRYHFLLGADWKLCCRKLQIDRGTFFHAVYRIEQRLGRVFRELEPYALYPLDEYFGGSYRDATKREPVPLVPRRSKRAPVVAPLVKAEAA